MEKSAKTVGVINDDTYRNKGGYAYYTHSQHGKNTMPICAWYAPPPPQDGYPIDQITLENYKIMAESGINTIYGFHDDIKENVIKGLKLANQVNMVYYVHDKKAIAALNEKGAKAV